jgi:hypothetical protein
VPEINDSENTINYEARREEYIFAQGNERERTAVNRLIVGNPGILSHCISSQLNLGFPCLWLGLRLPHRSVLRGLTLDRNQFAGDIDVCCGTIEPSSYLEYNELVQKEKQSSRPGTHPTWHHRVAWEKLLRLGKVKWPPDLNMLFAAEVKVAYFDSSDTLKATGLGGQKNKDRKQANALCQVGFDRVCLIRIIVTEPVSDNRLHPWMLASSRILDGIREMDENGVITDDTDRFGTVLFGAGAVPGDIETTRGANTWKWLKAIPENSNVNRRSEFRQAMERNLIEVMSRYTAPVSLPVLLLACSQPKCETLYVAPTVDEACPECGTPPR